MQFGIGRKTSQNALSCESKTFLSSLSRFLSTLLCAEIRNEIKKVERSFIELEILD